MTFRKMYFYHVLNMFHTICRQEIENTKLSFLWLVREGNQTILRVLTHILEHPWAQLFAEVSGCPFSKDVSLGNVLTCQGSCNKVPQTTTESAFLKFWRLEVSDQEDQQGWFLLRTMRERSVPGLSLWLAGGRVLPVSSPGLPSVCVYVQISSFYKNTSHIGFGPF